MNPDESPSGLSALTAPTNSPTKIKKIKVKIKIIFYVTVDRVVGGQSKAPM